MIDDPREPASDPAADTTNDIEFSNEHPLASPTELAGTAGEAIEAEFAARDAAETQADAAGSAAGIAYQEDELPLEGE
jgi:hypothetical protein